MKNIKPVIIYQLIVIISTFSYSEMFAQADYKKYNYYSSLAMCHNKKGNADSVVYYFEKALKFKKDFLLDHQLYVTQAYAEIGDTINLIENYKVLISFGVNIGLYDSILYLKGIKRETIKKRELNVEFIAEFSEYIGEEQFVRKRFFRDSCMAKYMYEVDSVNHIRLKKYIDTNGYPKEYELGKYRQIPLLLIIHIISNESTKNTWYDYYKPLLLAEAEKGNISYSLIATLDDRYNMVWNNYQLYGTIFFPKQKYEKTSKNKFFYETKIKDIEDVDKRRKSIGLPPLYISVKFYNIETPSDYKK